MQATQDRLQRLAQSEAGRKRAEKVRERVSFSSGTPCRVRRPFRHHSREGGDGLVRVDMDSVGDLLESKWLGGWPACTSRNVRSRCKVQKGRALLSPCVNPVLSSCVPRHDRV